jgi:hypothetical protein
LEAQNTTDADAIADVYIFRPLGLWLFSQKRFAKAVRRWLDPVIWPSLTSWDINRNQFLNTGLAYVYRPPRFRWGDKSLFVHTGFNNLFGLSHRRASGYTFSWGLGVAVEEVVRQRDIQADIKPSAGLFYDRAGSLLWSVVLNDTGNQRLRVNVFPEAFSWLKDIGIFLSIDDEGGGATGFVYGLPIGIGVSNDQ